MLMQFRLLRRMATYIVSGRCFSPYRSYRKNRCCCSSHCEKNGALNFWSDFACGHDSRCDLLAETDACVQPCYSVPLLAVVYGSLFSFSGTSEVVQSRS